jgi:hypothetical protein
MISRFKLLSAVAVLSAVVASPALAQQVISNPGYCAQFYPDANCQNNGPNNPYTGSYQRRGAYKNSARQIDSNGYTRSGDSWDAGSNNNWDNGWNNNNWNNNNWNTGWNDNWNNNWNDDRRYGRSGFWPGDVAGDVVGGAVNTAGAAVNAAGAIAAVPFGGFQDNRSFASADDQGSSYCAQRYRSFDPASGTYRGRDGKRHVCQQ